MIHHITISTLRLPVSGQLSSFAALHAILSAAVKRILCGIRARMSRAVTDTRLLAIGCGKTSVPFSAGVSPEITIVTMALVSTVN
jgi:hypothetical protein